MYLIAGQVGWFGLNDISNEGTFVWADNAALDPAFTNWANNQPDNNGNGQVSTQSRELIVNIKIYLHL